MDETNICVQCNKTYVNYKSLWHHNKMFHGGIKIIKKDVQKEEIGYDFGCRSCEKVYKHKQNRHVHEKTCTGIKDSNLKPHMELELEKTKHDTAIVNQETERIKIEGLKLQFKIQKHATKMSHRSFQSLNRELMDRSMTNSNNSNNSHNNNNNNIINNISIVGLGSVSEHEHILKYLTQHDKLSIMDARMQSIDKLVEMVHCGENSMFNNIIITNLKDKHAYMYDDIKGFYVTVEKSDMLDLLMVSRMTDLGTIFGELCRARLIDALTKQSMERLFVNMDNESETFTYNDIQYPNFKAFKTNYVKNIMYSNRDKIKKDIALFIKNTNIVDIQSQEPVFT